MSLFFSVILSELRARSQNTPHDEDEIAQLVVKIHSKQSWRSKKIIQENEFQSLLNADEEKNFEIQS